MSPVDEGGCGGYATQRCGEYKKAMKPRVAALAVECLNKLRPDERCDRNRVNLCGHLALMQACPEDDAAKPSALAPTCDAIVATCATATGPTATLASTLGPTLADCRRTLVGLNEAGRAQAADCVKQHCTDKGLLFCEAAPVATPQPRAAPLE